MKARRLFVAAFFAALSGCIFAAENRYSLNSDNVSWQVMPAGEDGSSPFFFRRGEQQESGVSATVPGTVFGSYVEQGLEETPEYGDNIYHVDRSKYNKSFWYRAQFEIPANFTNDKLWVNFEGINRKGEVYVNWRYVGTVDGFYERGCFEITDLLREDRPVQLAVLVHCSQEPVPNYASPTYISSASWDWMPYVPGLLSGITDDVYLTQSGPALISDPWIRTDSVSETSADLSVSVDIENTTGAEVRGVLTGTINPGNITFKRDVKISANHFSTVSLNASNEKALHINNARLWWPNGYGEQPLYTCQFKFEAGGKVSDEKDVRFGIRKYSYDTEDNVLHVSVNGKRIFLKGGNWGMSEYMLRCRGEEYYTKIRLHKEMNYNIIRNWLGSTTDEEFYKACDENGIMVWDDFWLNSHQNLPRDVFAFNKNAVEKIKRLRNYACVAVWCGDNEGYPVAPLNDWLREDVRVYDGGDRRYHANSHSDYLTGSGLWTNLEPRAYFASAPIGYGGEKGYGLRSEIGTAVFTNFESFKKFMPEKDWWPGDAWKENDMWNKHYFGNMAGNAGPARYYSSIVDRYGEPKNIEDFCKKAQLVNIETNKAMYEGWVNNIWDDASGIIIWMSQSAYPSFVWQTYDYYYDLTGAFWGAKKGCEPVHILWDSASNDVRVTNTSSQSLTGATATATVYNMDGKPVPGFSYKAENVSAASNSAATCFAMNFGDPDNLAYKKPAFASSFLKDAGPAADATDGSTGTRWGSEYSDPQWIYVDLEQRQTINEVHLFWEAAHASSFRLQISDDAKDWKDVHSNENCKGGTERVELEPVKCRYVRVFSDRRATMWGCSLWELQVFNKDRGKKVVNPLSDVHFIKLALTGSDGNLISENFYWRGNDYLDCTALEQLKEVNLGLKTSAAAKGEKQVVTASVSSPKNAPNVAFAVRVMLVNERTGEQVLPVFMNENYFSLLPGEEKEVTMEYDPALLAGDKPKVIVKQFASPDSVPDVEPKATAKKNGNPVFDGWYADPEVAVFGDTYWIFPTFSAEYRDQTHIDAFSSKDLVTWKKHPSVIDNKAVKWVWQAMWAPALVEKDGKYFIFFGGNDIQNNNQPGGIGVGVADKPEGPYKDYLGKPLIDKIVNGAQPIDQYVFKDKDGKYYIIYGGWGHCNIARLKDDFTGTIPFENGETYREITPENYVEGPTMFIKDGKYYFMWSEGGWGGPNYCVAYAIADSPFGPFKRIGKILQQDANVATSAGHHSVLNVPGTDKWYIIYHRRPLGDNGRDHRVTCIDKMEFDETGFIKPVKITFEGVEPISVPLFGR